MTRNLQSSNRRTALVFLSFLICAFTLGCSKEQKQPEPVLNPVPKKPAAPVQKKVSSARQNVQQPHSSAARKVSNQLDFTKRRDPFKPEIAEVVPVDKENKRGSSASGNKLPIQRYDVDRFKVTGIIAGLKDNRAMLVDPEGRGYVAKTGMQIGPNNGRIVRITVSTVEVEESFRDDANRLKRRTVKLSLQRKR